MSTSLNEFKYFKQILDSKNVYQLWNTYLEILSSFKFDRIIYAGTNIKQNDLKESLKDGLVLTNHSKQLIKTMIENKCFENDDPWLVKNYHHAKAWDGGKDPSAFLFYPSKREDNLAFQKKMMKAYTRYNCTSGYSLFFKQNIGMGFSGFSLCASPGIEQEEINEDWKKYGLLIITISKLFDMHLRQLPYVHFSVLPLREPLTLRQKETLFWLSKGKSICETSLILDLSVPTIDKHLRLARKNLSAKTTIEAMAKAQTNSQFLNLAPSY